MPRVRPAATPSTKGAKNPTKAAVYIPLRFIYFHQAIPENTPFNSKGYHMKDGICACEEEGFWYDDHPAPAPAAPEKSD